MKIEHFDYEVFLRDYWQKKPLFIKGAIPNFTSPLDGDELAALSLEEEAISRLVKLKIDGEVEKESDYELLDGPFTAETFSNLENNNWNLLIQEVDHWSDDVLALRELFDFIPHWRFDDVMASVGSIGGRVGAHLDWYDVFILQGAGKKKWRLESKARRFTEFENDHLVKGLDVKILSDFRPELEYDLEAGDLLYIPLGFAHQGYNTTESLSYSFGLRAPRMRDMIIAHLQDLLADIHEDQRLLDLPLSWSKNLGELPNDLNANLVLNWPSQLPLPRNNINNWFGKLVTLSTRHDFEFDEAVNYTPQEIQDLLQAENLSKNPHARFAYRTQEERVVFFVNGEMISLKKGDSITTPLEILCNELNPDLRIFLGYANTDSFGPTINFLLRAQGIIA